MTTHAHIQSMTHRSYDDSLSVHLHDGRCFDIGEPGMQGWRSRFERNSNEIPHFLGTDEAEISRPTRGYADSRTITVDTADGRTVDVVTLANSMVLVISDVGAQLWRSMLDYDESAKQGLVETLSLA